MPPTLTETPPDVVAIDAFHDAWTKISPPPPVGSTVPLADIDRNSLRFYAPVGSTVPLADIDRNSLRFYVVRMSRNGDHFSGTLRIVADTPRVVYGLNIYASTGELNSTELFPPAERFLLQMHDAVEFQLNATLNEAGPVEHFDVIVRERSHEVVPEVTFNGSPFGLQARVVRPMPEIRSATAAGPIAAGSFVTADVIATNIIPGTMPDIDSRSLAAGTPSGVSIRI